MCLFSIDAENDIAPKYGQMSRWKLKYLWIFFGSIALIHAFGCPEFLWRVYAVENYAYSIPIESDIVSSQRAGETPEDDNPETDDALGFEDDWENAFTQTGGIQSDAMPFSWRLNTALKNHFPTEPDLTFRDVNQKTELSLGLEISWAKAPYSFVAVTDGYFLIPLFNDDIRKHRSYSAETTIHRNLRISSRSHEIVFRELYINRDAGGYRLRIGNQLYRWGTADFINPTAYASPMDFREFMFKEDAESRFGIPSVSAMVFFDEFTTELFFTPIHTPPALPPSGHTWAIKTIGIRLPGIKNIPVELGNPEKLSVSHRNFGYGGRVSTTRFGIDAALSFYHGPDKDQLFVPHSISFQENQPVLFMQPESFVADYLGFDAAVTYGDFVFQAEGAFSPNRRGIVRQNSGVPYELEFPYDTRKSRFYAGSIGFNYFIPLHNWIAGHTGESLFTAEWYLSGYDANDISRPLLSDFLTLRYQDSYFDDRLTLSITQLIGARNRGLVWWPKVGYKFHNGLEMELAYISIYGRGTGDFGKDSLFYYYRDNDFIMINFRYNID